MRGVRGFKLNPAKRTMTAIRCVARFFSSLYTHEIKSVSDVWRMADMGVRHLEEETNCLLEPWERRLRCTLRRTNATQANLAIKTVYERVKDLMELRRNVALDIQPNVKRFPRKRKKLDAEIVPGMNPEKKTKHEEDEPGVGEKSYIL